jgi:hypothetical protein
MTGLNNHVISTQAGSVWEGPERVSAGSRPILVIRGRDSPVACMLHGELKVFVDRENRLPQRSSPADGCPATRSRNQCGGCTR